MTLSPPASRARARGPRILPTPFAACPRPEEREPRRAPYCSTVSALSAIRRLRFCGVNEYVRAAGRSTAAVSSLGARGLAPHEAFELAGGPVHRLVHGLSLLGVLGDHLGRRRLREDLVADPHRRRRAGHRLDHIAARRVIPDAALWRTFLGPGLEVSQSSEGRKVVTLAA